jgi:hypothetical protein
MTSQIHSRYPSTRLIGGSWSPDQATTDPVSSDIYLCRLGHDLELHQHIYGDWEEWMLGKKTLQEEVEMLTTWS